MAEAAIAALVDAIKEGVTIIDAFTKLYDDALELYGKFDGATQFKDRFRTLELNVVNATKYTLAFDQEYFDSGTWFWSPEPIKVKPGEMGMMYVANRQAAPTGVTGGVRYEIEGTNKYLFMGFTNPEFGGYKNFVTVSGAEHNAEWAYDNSKDDTVKQHDVDCFHVTATLRPPKKSPHKMFEYTIYER